MIPDEITAFFVGVLAGICLTFGILSLMGVFMVEGEDPERERKHGIIGIIGFWIIFIIVTTK